MRIAISFPGFHRRGGVERVFVEVVHELALRGHHVHAFAADVDESCLPDAAEMSRVKCLGHMPFNELLSFPAAAAGSIKKRGDFDVHASFGVQGLYADISWIQSVHARWLRVRNVSVMDAAVAAVHPFHQLVRGLERVAYRKRSLHRLLALTEDVRQDLVSLCRVDESKIAVLPNGYAPREFRAENVSAGDAVRHELALEPAARVLVFVANESKRKGLPQLISALARLPQDVHLVAVGRFDPEPVKEQAKRLGLCRRVHNVGSRTDVNRYYTAADAFVLPTRYEAWGLVIVEALASGLPVVTSRLAGASAAIEDGVTGILLDNPDDVDELTSKIGRILDIRCDRKRVSASVERFQWTKIVDDYERHLEEVAALKRRSA